MVVLEKYMVTLKEYAELKNISYEAVRKQVKRYAKELEEHIIVQNRTKYLDEYAVEYLNQKRSASPIIVQEIAKDEELEQLRTENKNLLLKIAQLQDELLKEKDNVQQLQQDKIELLEQKEVEEPQVKKSIWKRIFGQ